MDLLNPQYPGALAEIGRRARDLIDQAIFAERARIRRELLEWLVGEHPEDAGLICGRRVVTEIDRIFGKES